MLLSPFLFYHNTTQEWKNCEKIEKNLQKCVKIRISNVGVRLCVRPQCTDTKGTAMRTITTVEMNPDSREEYLPGYTPQFPHIASHIDGRLYQSDVAPWHWHESVELFYVRRGSILYRTPHAEHVVHAGCGGMVNSNILHTTKILDPSLDMALHLFSPSLVAGVAGGTVEQRYIRPLTADAGHELILLTPDDPAQTETLRRIDESLRLDEAAFGHEMRLQAMLTDIWLRLVEQVCPPEHAVPRNAADEKIKRMMVYIHTHYAERITAPQIAAAGYCSERECYRTFQTCLHTTPTEYLRTVRLQSACKLLMETDTPVTEIAQACGLGSSSYFGRLLRQEIGLSPSAYRAKWQKTTP